MSRFLALPFAFALASTLLGACLSQPELVPLEGRDTERDAPMAPDRPAESVGLDEEGGAGRTGDAAGGGPIDASPPDATVDALDPPASPHDAGAPDAGAPPTTGGPPPSGGPPPPEPCTPSAGVVCCGQLPCSGCEASPSAACDACTNACGGGQICCASSGPGKGKGNGNGNGNGKGNGGLRVTCEPRSQGCN